MLGPVSTNERVRLITVKDLQLTALLTQQVTGGVVYRVQPPLVVNSSLKIL